MRRGPALVALSNEHLRRLLALVHRGEVVCPMNIVELTRHGFQEQAGILLDLMRELDAAGVRAVLIAVLAERRAAESEPA